MVLAASVSIFNVSSVPRDVKASRHVHDAAYAVGFTRVFRSGVFFRIPRRRNSSALCADGYAADIALWCCRHAIAPVFSDLSHPISRQIERRITASRGRS